MQFEPVAFDSMGVKSSCFLIEAGNDRLIVDPGVSIESDSFPLSESRRLYLRSTMNHKVKKKAKTADAAVISHYHYDHYTQEPDRKVYGRKELYVKHPEQDINDEQRERAVTLLDEVEDVADQIEYADGRSFYFDAFSLKFGDPFWHGAANTGMGQVIPLVVEENASGRKLLYTSDMDGPVEDEATQWIIDEEPDVLVLNGAPTYMLDFVLDYEEYAKAVLNLVDIIEEVTPSKIILDHHLLRDYRYEDLYRVAFEAANANGVTMHTAAEEQGDQPKVREAYQENGGTKWSDWPRPSHNQLERLASGEGPDDVFRA
ncbi:MAG: MBL fold metallo-hydrolase [Candidatus Nanohaloarchaea archaeon]|nr:MBL fold metallo-hydrolase [Candidatus Nanohaloarchaea archaeon]